MTWSTSTPHSIMKGEGGRWPCAMDLPSPLAGEGQGGGEPPSHATTETRVWPLRSLVRFVKIAPTPSGGFGLGCANGSSRDTASGDKLPSDLTSSTSRVSQRGWSLRSMVASTAGGPSRMPRAHRGCKPMASKFCASGITRCSPVPTGCWRRSAKLCATERRIDPPPRPSPTRGEGVRAVACDLSQQRLGDLCIRQGRAKSGGDELDRVKLRPGRHRRHVERRRLRGLPSSLAGEG
jgi:hypothetical protein